MSYPAPPMRCKCNADLRADLSFAHGVATLTQTSSSLDGLASSGIGLFFPSCRSAAKSLQLGLAGQSQVWRVAYTLDPGLRSRNDPRLKIMQSEVAWWDLS
jgi:hypothetical protein